MLAEEFHIRYEKLAPSFGYTTRSDSAKPWAEVPSQNRALMTAVCKSILDDFLFAAAEVCTTIADGIARQPVFRDVDRVNVRDTLVHVMFLKSDAPWRVDPRTRALTEIRDALDLVLVNENRTDSDLDVLFETTLPYLADRARRLVNDTEEAPV